MYPRAARTALASQKITVAYGAAAEHPCQMCRSLVVAVYSGCSTEICKKIGPLMTTTGPQGHIQNWVVDLEHKATRTCFYLHDTLYHEYVFPFDVDSPAWNFAEKFVTVHIFFKFLFRVYDTQCIFSTRNKWCECETTAAHRTHYTVFRKKPLTFSFTFPWKMYRFTQNFQGMLMRNYVF